MKKQYIFCGGGSGGHVLPALSLIRKIRLEQQEAEVYCIGSHRGIEARILADFNYKSISTGKLRRYLSIENIVDIFRVFWGILQAYSYLLRFSKRECVVISTGGFVTVPVIVAAWLQGKKIVLHEQTTRAGLANRIAAFFADKCLLTFEESRSFFPPEKSVVVGYPFRKEIFDSKELEKFGEVNLTAKSKILILVTGGGNGSKLLNEAILSVLSDIPEAYVFHQCGSAYIEEYSKFTSDNYQAFDFLGDEMIPLMKRVDIVISRAGAGTVCELMAIGKPSILIPLKIAQKNEQYHNAMAAKERLGSIVLEEENLNNDSLLNAIEEIKKREAIAPMQLNPIDQILKEISKI